MAGGLHGTQRRSLRQRVWGQAHGGGAAIGVRSAVVAIFNPFLPSFIEDPYSAYARLRSEEPVHRSLALQAWILTAYEDCATVLRDHETFSSESQYAKSPLAQALEQQRLESPLGDVPTVLTSDPPVHTRLRSIVNRGLTPRVVEGLGPRIEEITASLLSNARDGGCFDVMSGLAQPLPVIVIAELLGVPPDDRGLFKRWSNAIAAATSVLTPPEVIEGARHAVQELIDYLERVVNERRAEPREDLISLLVRAEVEGDSLSSDELLAFSILLLVAGNETTTNLIGNGMLALLRAPERWAQLRSRPELVPGAVEELLRFDSPVQGVVRFARADAEIGGVRIGEGETVLALIGAANRDPQRFPQPDVLTFDGGDAEHERHHLSLGMGAHYCLGSPLARLEAQVAFTALLAAFEAPRLAAAGATRGGTFLLRGLSRLEVEPA